MAPSVRAAIWRGLLCAAGLAAPAGGRAAVALLPHSVTGSGQFYVYAQESAVRGAVGTVAEETKTSVLHALGLGDEWKLPIVIALRTPDGAATAEQPAVRLDLAQTGVGLKIELDFLVGATEKGARIRDELVRALLLEISYRNRGELPAGQSFTPPPSWLVEGLSAFVENEEDGVSGSLFTALLPASQTLSVEEFLRKNPAVMDATSRSVYRAYAFNLVNLLLKDLPAGRPEMVAFLRDLPQSAPTDPMDAAALRQHFPELAAAPDSLEKWWALSLARMATADRYLSLTVEETERQLVPLLSFNTAATGGSGTRTYTLDDYGGIASKKERERMLASMRTGLLALGARANPLYHPIITGYQQVVSALARGRSHDVAGKLRELEKERNETQTERTAVADFLNWFEATQVAMQSGAFDDYLRDARLLERSARSHRPDAISAYMDGMEMEYR